MDYFISDQCYNLAHHSGAIDPGKLILNVDNIPFVPQVWRLNTKSSTHKFRLRLGGLFTSYWNDAYGVDGNGNKFSPEGAGFGITDK